MSRIYFRCSYGSHINSEAFDWNKDLDILKLFIMKDETPDSIVFIDYNFVLAEDKPIIERLLMLKRQQLRCPSTNGIKPTR